MCECKIDRRKKDFESERLKLNHWWRDKKKYTDWYRNRPKYRGNLRK